MKLIAHRGNISGKNPEKENQIDYITNALNEGYDVEIDIWNDNEKWYLGHDEPMYLFDVYSLMSEFSSIWFHCKNFQALEKLLRYVDANCFWHEFDKVTLTSKRYIWAYPGYTLRRGSICVLPEVYNISDKELKLCSGICSDYIERYKNL